MPPTKKRHMEHQECYVPIICVPPAPQHILSVESKETKNRLFRCYCMQNEIEDNKSASTCRLQVDIQATQERISYNLTNY